MACIYILYGRTINRFYTGASRNDNANERLKAHNNNETKSTKMGYSWIIIHEERFSNYTEARKRELFLKSGAGRKWITEQFGQYKREGCLSG
ncbi:MAG: GIY-YIG nuclease family protein [Planctomycetota bacterium]|nr:GIY-YIG nuclease family protein [Planctomycetota bacterium]MDI6788049.1 GIY-YIG nuclease family protein [Planctomycetota bacterium]